MTDIYKQVHQLPELCSIVFGSLCEWDIERQTQFSLYCYHLFSLVDTPAPVVYTRYFLFKKRIS
jgi:hypothetical protein